MKNKITDRNIQFILLLTLSVAETLIIAIFKPFKLWRTVFTGAVAIFAVTLICFADFWASYKNRRYSYFYRRKFDGEDDEPSDFAIVATKITGYLFLGYQTVLLFL